MVARQVDFAVLDDDARWADDSACVDLLFAGIWFLHDTLKSHHGKCALLPRITQLGDNFERIALASGLDASRVSAADASAFFSEMNILGTLGHSLWRLKEYLNTPGLRDELKELVQVKKENRKEDKDRLRSRGFLLQAAGELANQEFKLEFIRCRDGERTPDFFAIRDGNRFACEATTRYPEKGDFSNVGFFWETIHQVVEKKRGQLQGSEFTNGVLIIDCSSVWEAFNLSHVPIGGEIFCSIPENLGGPRTVSAPLVRYDESSHSVGLQRLEEIIRGTTIETVILWNHQLELWETGYRRRMEYRILGTVHGCVFWSYFPKQCVFPGPKMNVVWPQR